MDDEDVLDLGCQVLPWISNQVILIGLQTRNKVYCTLGCELFVLSQQVASISETAIARQKLLKIFEIVDKACSADRFRALKRIRSYKDSTSKIRQTLIKETQEILINFVLKTPEYHTLLRLIPDCLATYATCRCCTDVSFELVFKANYFSPTHSQSFVQWKESNVIVPRAEVCRRAGIQKRKKPLSPKKNRSRVAQRMRRLELGEFCTLINDLLGNPVHFYIQSNVLKVIEPLDPYPCRGQWLEKIPHVSNKGKSHLAYTIAKSVWQYYDSPWMITPWTHESIQLLNEGTGLTGRGKPHPYLRTKLVRAIVKSKDYYYANDLMHRYPNILALGILLIEIAVKQPLTSEECPYPLSEAVINDYYTSNLKDTAQSREVDVIRARQNALYEKIVLPLKRLSDSYRDDWDIQSLPTENTTETFSDQNISNKAITASESPLQADFTVAIFFSVLFDGFCEDSTLHQNAPGDSNTYTLGRMVHLPGMGKSVASQAASSIRSTYPNIKLAWWSEFVAAEILLGDIVVSDGIVQHDFGRRVPGAFLRKTSVTDGLGRPNVAIRGFLSKIKTTLAQKRIGSKMEKYLEAINQTLGNDAARYPGVEHDELFQSTYRHKHQDPVACISCTHSTNKTVCDEVFDLTCHQLKCNKEKLVQRERLQTAFTLGHTPSPTIHLGLIASGDTVMKSGQDRDLIATQDIVNAFEMEGVGVWDSLPCLVVKVVCDYADSHKNKIWQPYAAATGAACMKALLDEWTL
ncbi:hypothetical protein BGW36DRAFT_401502 [Talaromyces proteolyticus]|uniref:DUF7580 domain-containing protein n=1 Tax=Talaromyces proteolyticus TaxID=1131652 RepID=A0AAD4KFV2_9EURO|nr:uncharacterized protein BGW36DRAFT_401502 [Talaromyces proteolyticus]KAH8690066.1 hypothetical protein BGW36DRAFT_401502 [Talaromyces proteolyticus]